MMVSVMVYICNIWTILGFTCSLIILWCFKDDWKDKLFILFSCLSFTLGLITFDISFGQGFIPRHEESYTNMIARLMLATGVIGLCLSMMNNSRYDVRKGKDGR
jgi:hypothetical protein